MHRLVHNIHAMNNNHDWGLRGIKCGVMNDYWNTDSVLLFPFFRFLWLLFIIIAGVPTRRFRHLFHSTLGESRNIPETSSGQFSEQSSSFSPFSQLAYVCCTLIFIHNIAVGNFWPRALWILLSLKSLRSMGNYYEELASFLDFPFALSTSSARGPQRCCRSFLRFSIHWPSNSVILLVRGKKKDARGWKISWPPWQQLQQPGVRIISEHALLAEGML